MDKRDEWINSCRPNISVEYDVNQASEELVFQNVVLRPILKFQNVLLVNLFIQEIASKKIDVSGLNNQDLRQRIKQLLVKDQNIKHKMIGICIALFTENELAFYFKLQKSINKRILSMLEERILDNFLSDSTF